MKIFHIVNNLEAGGAQTFIYALAVEQQQRGNEVSVVIVYQKKDEAFEKDLVTKFNTHHIEVFFLERRLGKNFSIFKSIKRLNAILKKNKPDIVNSHLTLSHNLIAFYLRFLKPGSSINRS